MVHLKKFFEGKPVNVGNGKRKCPHIFYVKTINKGFILLFISSSSPLASSFLKLVLSYLSILSAWKKKRMEKKTFLEVFLMTRTKFLWALKFTVEKFMSKNWKRNQRSHASLLSIFLPSSTTYNWSILCMYHSLKMVKCHNSE